RRARDHDREDPHGAIVTAYTRRVYCRALWSSLASCLALAACIKIKDFNYRDGGTGDGSGPGGGAVTAVMQGSGALVTAGDRYTMRFGAVGFHFPDSFVIGGTEMFVVGDGIDCTDEKHAGVVFHPLYRFDGLVDHPS